MCPFSKLQAEKNANAEGLDSDKLDESNSTNSQENTPIKVSADAAVSPPKGSSHGGSREPSCVLSEVFSDQNVEWKLDIEDISSRNTFKTLERIKQ